MKNKLTMLVLEVILGITVLIMVVNMKRTLLSPIVGVKLLSLAYIVIAVAVILMVVRQILRDDENTGFSEENSLTLLFSICKSKGLVAYAETVQAQTEKLEKRTKNLEKMLDENFGEDTRTGEISAIINRYRGMFFKNVDRIVKRADIMDPYSINTNMVDRSLKEESDKIYREHIGYIEDKINANEKITIELDKLATELSRINDSDGENNLEPLQDYINALRNLNDNAADDEMEQLMRKY
jgi:protein-arginine kinase activator protein McsA